MELRRALDFPPDVDRLASLVGLTVAVFLHGDDGQASIEGLLYSVCPETGALALLGGGAVDGSGSVGDSGGDASCSSSPSLKLVFAHAVEQVYVVPGSKSAAEIARSMDDKCLD